MKINKQTIGEIWENASFDSKSFELLENTIENKSTEEDTFYELTTTRNRLLINPSQQNKLINTTIAVFGLSVGSHTALTWILESRAKNIKIFDPDIIASTNLNRLRLSLKEVGKYKIDIFKKQINEINPYSNVVASKSTDKKTVENILNAKPKVQFIIDAMDDLKSKINIRKYCQKNNIPLISAADVGDNITIDIERYDHKNQPDPFLGYIPLISDKELSKLTFKKKLKLILDLLTFENHSEEMLNSLFEIGKSISTWPQLGATATITGGVVTTIIKKIVLGEKIKSGRYYLSLDNLLVIDHNSNDKINRRKKLQIKIINKLKNELF